MLSKQIDKDVKMYSGPPASMPNNINNIPLSKAISQKMEKIRIKIKIKIKKKRKY